MILLGAVVKVTRIYIICQKNYYHFMIVSQLKIEPWTVIIDKYAGRSSERIKIARCSDKKRSWRGPGEGGEGGGGSIVFRHLSCFP